MEDSKFELLPMTDEDIVRKADHKQVLNYGDYNLHGNPKPIKGGLFDPSIFGSVNRRVCSCGFTKVRDTESPPKRCPNCKDLVFSRIEDYENNSAYYQLSIPVVFPYRAETFFATLKRNGINPVKPQELRSTAGWSTKLLIIWDNYFKPVKTEDNDCFMTDSTGEKYNLEIGEVDDFTERQYIGLIGLYNLKSYNLKNPIEFDKFINRNIPITSTYFRRSALGRRGGRTILDLDRQTILYTAIIRYDSEMRTKVLPNLIGSSIDQATAYYNLNLLVAKMMNSISLLQGGKFHLTRNQLRTRVKRSMRANITPALDLNMDQVYVPRAMAYEALNGDIRARLSEMMSPAEAREEYVQHTPRAEGIFREIVDESMVLLLRNPTNSIMAHGSNTIWKTP